MSYIEDAVYSFIKNIFTRGIIILTNKRFITYTIIALLLPVLLTVYSFIKGEGVTTMYNFLSRLELAACVGLVITGLISFKVQLVKIEHLVFILITIITFMLSFNNMIVNIIEDVFVFVSFYSWIITTNIAGLVAIREFMVSWPGWVLRLGDPKERLLFGPLIKIIVFSIITWFAYSLINDFSWMILLGLMTTSLVIYAIYVILPVFKDSVFVSIVSFYFFSLLYHLFVRAETSTGLLILDISIIVATTIFTAQSISNFIASKKHAMPYYWDSLIILLLGFMLGYHLLGVKLALFGGLKYFYGIYHDLSFGFGSIIIFGLVILYVSKPSFRSFSTQRVTLAKASRRVAVTGLKAVTNYLRSIKELISKREWEIEIKKKTDEESQDKLG